MSLVIISHVKTTTDTTTKKQSKLYLHLVTSKCCSCQISANRMPIIIVKNHLLRNTRFYINFQLQSSPFYWHTKFVHLSKGSIYIICKSSIRCWWMIWIHFTCKDIIQDYTNHHASHDFFHISYIHTLQLILETQFYYNITHNIATLPTTCLAL